MVIADNICKTHIGDIPCAEKAEIAASIAAVPKILKLLQDLANPRRGSNAEKWSIHNAAHEAAEILALIKSTKERL